MSSFVPGTPSPNQPEVRLNQKVIGACLRSAFIEALYDDCTDMLPPEPAELQLRAGAPASIE